MRVYAVWFSVMPEDNRYEWPKDLLEDPRVIQYWDNDLKLGRMYGQEVTNKPFEWDAYFMYDPSARWEDEVPKAYSSGRTILAARDSLKYYLLEVLEDRARPPQ